MSAKPKVLFVGLDSAEPELLVEWARSGQLPNLREVFERSASWPCTAPAGFGNGVLWPSLFTGVNPAKHGRYFYRQVRPGTYQASAFTEDTDYRCEPFWVTLSRAGRRVGVIDMVRAPLTKGLNGVQLVDWLTHDRTGESRSWPADLAGRVVAKYGVDPLGGSSEVAGRSAADFADLRARMLRRIKAKTDLVVDFLRASDWDLFSAVYADPHDIGHQCWHLHDPSHPRHDAAVVRQIGDPVKDVYTAIDAAVGRLLEAAGPETTVVLFSGPGMGPGYTANFLLDRVLQRLEASAAGRSSSPLGTLKAAYRRIAPAGLRNRLRHLAERTEEAMTAPSRRSRRCFAVPHNENAGAIRINVIGREPNGRIQRGREYDRFCESLVDDLMDLRNLESGERLVDDVVRVRDAYKGEHVDELPDLMVIWNRRNPIRAIGSEKIGEIRAAYPGDRTGDHTPHASLFVRGPGIEPIASSKPVSVMDVSPTLCSLLGVGMQDSDGSAIVTLKDLAAA